MSGGLEDEGEGEGEGEGSCAGSHSGLGVMGRGWRLPAWPFGLEGEDQGNGEGERGPWSRVEGQSFRRRCGALEL